MKTEEEVRNEIQLSKNTIANYRNAYKNGKISKDVLYSNVIDCNATIAALKWVLEENDRFD